MKHILRCFCGLCVFAFTTDSQASFLAYQVTSPANTVGNQVFGGAIGADFQVNQSIDIRRLGAFDSAGDGLNSPITVKLWSKTSLNANTGIEIMSLQLIGSSNPLESGYRFATLTTPLTLPPGFYTISTSGYGKLERLGNANNPGLTVTKEIEDGGGLLSFGQSRYTKSVTAFPSISRPFARSSGPFVFLAGNFDYDATPIELNAAAPEPSSIVLGLIALTGFGMTAGCRARRAKRARRILGATTVQAT